jgi:putative SOS response-associated peptidase YedK
MCGRFRLTRASKLAERFGIEPEDDWVPRYNIAPTQYVKVIRQHAEEPKGFGLRAQRRQSDVEILELYHQQ